MRASIDYNRDFQPTIAASRYMSDCNEVEGKSISFLTNYFICRLYC